MRYRSILVAAVCLAPVAAWTASKDFNGRMWLAHVPGIPSSAEGAYAQWIDDGNGGLKPGEAFSTVDQGIDAVIADQATLAAQGGQGQMQQQAASAQQMAAKYGTPEGQAALKAMTPAQLMALSQQMMPQPMAPRAVSPADQELLQKLDDGVYPERQQVMTDVEKLQIEINSLDSRWDQELAALGPEEQAEMRQLPVCPGEAAIPSSQEQEKLELKYADQRISIATRYLSQFVPIVDKARATVLPEIDFGDDALAAWTQISDAGLKQQASPSAHGAQQQGLGDVGTVEKMVEGVSSRAAEAVMNKKAIERKFANAKGC